MLIVFTRVRLHFPSSSNNLQIPTGFSKFFCDPSFLTAMQIELNVDTAKVAPNMPSHCDEFTHCTPTPNISGFYGGNIRNVRDKLRGCNSIKRKLSIVDEDATVP